MRGQGSRWHGASAEGVVAIPYYFFFATFLGLSMIPKRPEASLRTTYALDEMPRTTLVVF